MKKICYLVLFTAYFTSWSNSENPPYLTPLIESGKLEDAKKTSLVRSSQFRCNTESYSGFLTVEKKYNSNLFFWFFKAKDPKAPVILWLQGGPGASSIISAVCGALGPFRIKKNLNLQCNKYSWTKAFSVLYIDSPVGVGFSFTESDDGYPKTVSNITDNLYIALKQFFTVFEEQRTNEFYIAGSAGKFISSLAYRIHKANENVTNLKGLAIGNGIFDPVSSLAYGPHLYQLGLIDEKQKDLFDDKEKEIQSLIANEQYEQAFDKWDVLIVKMLYQGETIFEKTTGYSYYYDVRVTKVESGSTRTLVTFLNQNRTRKALHAGNVPFVLGYDHNEHILKALRAEICRSVKRIMGELMENFKVLLYSGNMDIILPGVIGNQFLKTLQWKHLQEYLSSSQSIWWANRNDTEVAGYIRKVQKFRELIVRNAGHSVPFDQPRVALHMISQFVANEL